MNAVPKPTPLPPARNTPETDLVIAAFTSWYTGHTRSAYETDLDMLSRWCARENLDVLRLTRLQLEAYVKYLLDERGNKLVTAKRRLATLARFYMLICEDGVIPATPATHVRIPRHYKTDDADLRPYLDRYELAHFIAVSRRVSSEYALVMLMGVLGLRVGEAIALDIADYRHVEDGHRVLKFVGKGHKPATIPLPVPVLRALDQAAGHRVDGPLLIRPYDGGRYPYRAALRAIVRITAAAGIDKEIRPHSLRRSFVAAGLDAGMSELAMQIAGRWADGRMVRFYDHRHHSLDRHAAYSIATFIAGAG